MYEWPLLCEFLCSSVLFGLLDVKNLQRICSDGFYSSLYEIS